MAPLSLIDVHDAVPTGAAARYLNVSDSYVRRLMRDGRLPSIPTPLGHLIPMRALEAFSRARERAVRSPGRTP